MRSFWQSIRFALAIGALQTSILMLATAAPGSVVQAGEPTGQLPASPTIEDNRTERARESLTAQGAWTGAIKRPDSTETSAPHTRPRASPAKRVVRTRQTRTSTESARLSPERTARYWTGRLVHGLRRIF